MWDLPEPGIKSLSPALAGGFLTTGPPGKSGILGPPGKSGILFFFIKTRNTAFIVMIVVSNPELPLFFLHIWRGPVADTLPMMVRPSKKAVDEITL